jgi:hypothetical protein
MNTGPINDGDSFWHLSTGKWIWENKTLPDSDPFSYTVGETNALSGDSGRIRFILKQNWLGQVILYGVWTLGGNTGIVLFRALIYSAILLFMFIWMRKDSKGLFPILILVLTGYLLNNFPSERPQLFTFMFVPLALYLVDGLIVRERTPVNIKFLLLPFLMALWANLHGGYLLGIVLILIYASGHILKCILRKVSPRWPELAMLLISIVVSYFNPVRFNALLEFTRADPYGGDVYEHISPLSAAMLFGDYYPVYWAFLLIVGLLLIRSFKHAPLERLLAMISLVGLSMLGLRYMPFIFFAAPLLAASFKEDEPGGVKVVIFSMALILLFATADWKRAFIFKPARIFPEGAVAFIETNKPAPNMFNYYTHGGYLAWRLPSYKVFIDGRRLMPALDGVYESVIWGRNSTQMLYAYGINTVIIPGMSYISGNVFPLAEILLMDPEWELVYADDVVLMYLKNVPLNRKIIERHRLGNEKLYEHIVNLSGWLIPANPEKKAFSLARANALLKLKKHK